MKLLFGIPIYAAVACGFVAVAALSVVVGSIDIITHGYLSRDDDRDHKHWYE